MASVLAGGVGEKNMKIQLYNSSDDSSGSNNRRKLLSLVRDSRVE